MRNRAVVLVTHHVSLVQPHASALYRIEHGQLVSVPIEQLPVKASASATPFEQVNTPSEEQEEEEIDLDKIQHRFISEESRAKGAVRWRVYSTYLKAVGWPIWLLMLVFLVLVRASRKEAGCILPAY
jgi:hypothetical protein